MLTAWEWHIYIYIYIYEKHKGNEVVNKLLLEYYCQVHNQSTKMSKLLGQTLWLRSEPQFFHFYMCVFNWYYHIVYLKNPNIIGYEHQIYLAVYIKFIRYY